MVVQSRTDIGRNRLLYLLTIILSIAVLVTVGRLYSSEDSSGILLLILGAAGLLAIFISLIQFYGSPRRSHALLIHSGNEFIVATNATHEGFKFRFIRDILSENMVDFSDADRNYWKFLEEDGYFPALCIKHPKKLLVLRLCTMIFDDVYFIDSTNRWEHHECANTSEPTFSNNDKPQLPHWKGFASQS